jgi:hypothetical protein
VRCAVPRQLLDDATEACGDVGEGLRGLDRVRNCQREVDKKMEWRFMCGCQFLADLYQNVSPMTKLSTHAPAYVPHVLDCGDSHLLKFAHVRMPCTSCTCSTNKICGLEEGHFPVHIKQYCMNMSTSACQYELSFERYDGQYSSPFVTDADSCISQKV